MDLTQWARSHETENESFNMGSSYNHIRAAVPYFAVLISLPLDGGKWISEFVSADFRGS
jgi:hypothetical protein